MADEPRKVEIVDEDWFTPAKPEDVRRVVNDLIDGKGITKDLSDKIEALTKRVKTLEDIIKASNIEGLKFYIENGVLCVEYEE